MHIQLSCLNTLDVCTSRVSVREVPLYNLVIFRKISLNGLITAYHNFLNFIYFFCCSDYSSRLCYHEEMPFTDWFPSVSELCLVVSNRRTDYRI